MSDLTRFRDHCRTMATAEHKPECEWPDARKAAQHEGSVMGAYLLGLATLPALAAVMLGRAGGRAMSKYADIHSVLCHVHAAPHGHGLACHSTCPTCGGERYLPPAAQVGAEGEEAL